MIEIWKPIKNYEGLYEISNMGRIKSFYNGKWGLKLNKYKIRKNLTDKSDYHFINLCKRRKVKSFKISRLVLETFMSISKNKVQAQS